PDILAKRIDVLSPRMIRIIEALIGEWLRHRGEHQDGKAAHKNVACGEPNRNDMRDHRRSEAVTRMRPSSCISRAGERTSTDKQRRAREGYFLCRPFLPSLDDQRPLWVTNDPPRFHIARSVNLSKRTRSRTWRHVAEVPITVVSKCSNTTRRYSITLSARPSSESGRSDRTSSQS